MKKVPVIGRKRYVAVEIVNKLRQADVKLSMGSSDTQSCKLIGVTERTYYRWRREYGGMMVGQAQRLKNLPG